MQMRKHVTNVSACYVNITRLSLFLCMILEGHPIHEGTLRTRLMLTTPTQCKLLSSLHTVWWLGRCLSYVQGYVEPIRLRGTVPWYFCAVNGRLTCSTHEAYSGLCSSTLRKLLLLALTAWPRNTQYSEVDSTLCWVADQPGDVPVLSLSKIIFLVMSLNC